jgi:4-hydroxy-2,2'-bipyrrole-5-carbaldehyde O-methyltransferase
MMGPVRYWLELARTGVRLPHKRAHGLLLRDYVTWLRVEVLGAAASAGVLAALDEPRTVDELARATGATDIGLLGALLRAGEAVGELARDGDGRWRLAGVRARAMVDPAVDGLAAMPEEALAYGSDVYRQLPERLRGAPPGRYLPTYGELVARASRVAEPVVGPLVTEIVRRRAARRVLDVGCGSGVNIHHVAAGSPTVTGAGIDVDAGVVALARRNLSAWGLGERFPVHEADVRALPDELAGPWDVVLLLQNVYYFDGADRAELLRGLRRLSREGGAVLVATAVRDTADPFAAHLDVVLRSTAGNTPLPTVGELHADLAAAGFTEIEEHRLAPRQPLRAVLAA